MKTKSLKKRGVELSNTMVQLKVLNGKELVDFQFPKFQDKIKNAGFDELITTDLEIFQINIGKLCNQVCTHCHVDAGPDRKEENMDRATLERCLEIIKSVDTIHTIDITGGAPELNPHFKWFVESCSSIGKRVINRCNLTVITANKKYNDLPEFFAKHKVHVVSSLPYFSAKRTDKQRGDGVFEASIKGLQMLNAVGYGVPGSGLILDLVYNPSGALMPASQSVLEPQFTTKLKENFDVVFNSLIAITNLPIARFLDFLLESGNYEEYMEQLVGAFNPATVENLMCRNTISVSWDGHLYDCDFNQMLELKVDSKSNHLTNFDIEQLKNRNVVLNQHCYGCTAGAGSSCGGEIV